MALMPYMSATDCRSKYQDHLFHELRISLSLLQDLQKLVIFQSPIRIFSMHSQDIIAGDRVDDLMPHSPSNLIIFIKDIIIRDTLSNTNETIREIAGIDHTARQSETAKRIA